MKNRKMANGVVALLLTLAMIISCLPMTVFAALEENITVRLDGRELEFDVPPQIVNGRTMVPLRKIFESMGAKVDWDNSTQTAIATDERCIVHATINNNTMKINGTPKTLDVAPQLIGGRTLVPARFVAEAFGATVDWDSYTSTVIISSLKESEKTDTSDTETDTFTYGYEKAEFSRYNSNASENGLGGTMIYLLCTIDKIEYLDTDAGKVIIGYITDDSNNNWLTLMHTTALVDKNEYNNIVGKPITLLGKYEGFSETEKMPVVNLYKLRANDTGEIKSGIEMILYEENDNETGKPTLASDKMVLYTADGRNKEVPNSEVDIYKKLYWYEEPVQIMYATDGRTTVIPKREVESYKNVGWYSEPLVIMYAADGRTIYVEQSKVEEQKSVGWYLEPVVLMYAADGRTIYVGQSEVEAYKNVGWYLEPVVTMYAADGRTLNVLKSEVEAHKKVGWFTDGRDAVASKYPKHNVKILEIGDIWYDSFNGVGFPVYWRNDSGKTIKYITFTVVPYNAVGDMVSCTITGKTAVNEKYTGPFNSFDRYNIDNNYFYWKGDYATGFIEESPGINYFTIRKGYNPDDPSTYWTATEEKYYLTDSDYNYVFDKESFFGPVWYNYTVKSVKITKIYVEYMDGTRETIKNPPIWKDMFVNAGL